MNYLYLIEQDYSEESYPVAICQTYPDVQELRQDLEFEYMLNFYNIAINFAAFDENQLAYLATEFLYTVEDMERVFSEFRRWIKKPEYENKTPFDQVESFFDSKRGWHWINWSTNAPWLTRFTIDSVPGIPSNEKAYLIYHNFGYDTYDIATCYNEADAQELIYDLTLDECYRIYYETINGTSRDRDYLLSWIEAHPKDTLFQSMEDFIRTNILDTINLFDYRLIADL